MQGSKARLYTGRSSHRVRLVLLALLVVVAVCYGRAVTFKFVNYDENLHVIDNELIRSLSPASIRAMFTDLSGRSYYPVRTLSFAVDYAIWKLNPSGYHLTNVLLHAANTALVFLLILRGISSFAGTDGAVGKNVGGLPPTLAPEHSMGWGDVLAAGFGGALFAIHPVVVEPVAWVSGREELLMMLFALLCLHAHQSARQCDEARRRGDLTSWKRGWAWHAAACICFVLSCMSNAVGAVVPALVLMHDVLVSRISSFRRLAAGNWPMWALAAGAVLLKLSRIDVQPSGQAEHRTLLLMSIPERIYTALALYQFNLKTVTWPSELILVYPNVLSRSLFALRSLVGLLLAVMTLAVLWRFRRKPLVLAGLIWFLLALAPSAQLLPHHIFRADRFLYLPMAGVAWTGAIVVRAAVQQSQRVRLTGIVAVAVLGVLFGLTWRQVGYWRDAISLFSRTIRYNPFDADPYNLRARAYIERGEQALALADLHQAIARNPTDPDYRVNRALIYENLGRQAEAVADYTEALRLQSADADAYSKRGKMLLEQKQFDQAVMDLGRAISLKVLDAGAYYSRGNAFAGLGKVDEAIADFTEAIRLRPEYVEAYNNRGSLYLQQGHRAEAVADFQKAIEIDPSYVGGLVNLGNLHAREGEYAKAIPYFTRALEVTPGESKALWARARAHALMDRPDLAAGDYGRLLAVEPTNPLLPKEWGNACVQMNQLDSALAQYGRAIELAPNDVDTYNRRGIVLARLGKLDRAISDFDKAIELAPADLAGYANRGLAFAQSGAFDRARADWQRLVELDPSGPVGEKARRSLERLGGVGPVESRPASTGPSPVDAGR